eukprot:359522-Chlamydomonas_euryale.AAC.2
MSKLGGCIEGKREGGREGWRGTDGGGTTSQKRFASLHALRACVDAEGASPGAFRHFWICDSCPSAADVSAPDAPDGPFEVLSLAGPIAAALKI